MKIPGVDWLADHHLQWPDPIGGPWQDHNPRTPWETLENSNSRETLENPRKTKKHLGNFEKNHSPTVRNH